LEHPKLAHEVLVALQAKVFLGPWEDTGRTLGRRLLRSGAVRVDVREDVPLGVWTWGVHAAEGGAYEDTGYGDTAEEAMANGDECARAVGYLLL
jgi:hypothetical protein